MDRHPPPDGRGTAEQRSVAGPVAGQAVERFGPLALWRMAKDDGRSLIVYERADRPPQDGSGDPGADGSRA